MLLLGRSLPLDLLLPLDRLLPSDLLLPLLRSVRLLPPDPLLRLDQPAPGDLAVPVLLPDQSLLLLRLLLWDQLDQPFPESPGDPGGLAGLGDPADLVVPAGQSDLSGQLDLSPIPRLSPNHNLVIYLVSPSDSLYLPDTDNHYNTLNPPEDTAWKDQKVLPHLTRAPLDQLGRLGLVFPEIPVGPLGRLDPADLCSSKKVLAEMAA